VNIFFTSSDSIDLPARFFTSVFWACAVPTTEVSAVSFTSKDFWSIVIMKPSFVYLQSSFKVLMVGSSSPESASRLVCCPGGSKNPLLMVLLPGFKNGFSAAFRYDIVVLYCGIFAMVPFKAVDAYSLPLKSLVLLRTKITIILRLR
jgi:hypothetical protein